VPGGDADFVAKVVNVVRATRVHPGVRIGSSVRGAIDLVLVAVSLGALRRSRPDEWSVGLDAALAALSGRIRLHEGSARTADDVVRELWVKVFGEPEGKAAAG
jgi:MoxR-like ATPase